MVQAFALVSSAEIKHKEYVTLLHEAGAVMTPDDADYDARISRDKLHVWIHLNNASLETELEGDDLERMAHILGGRPQTYIQLYATKGRESQQLVLEFACLCAQRYPCVVDDNMGKVFSSEELFELRDTGKVFDEE